MTTVNEHKQHHQSTV